MLVNEVVVRNGGRPYTYELLIQLQKGAQELREQVAKVNSMDSYSDLQVSKLKEQFNKSYEEKLQRLTDMIDLKLNESTQKKLAKQLEEERARRIEAKKATKEAQEEKAVRLEEEKAALVEAEKLAKLELMERAVKERQLREELVRAQKVVEELRNRPQHQVIDIEEMAWAPKYGLKGMIDASLRVRTDTDSGEVKEIVMPLEFKTGKATIGQAAMEHKAQVMLYTLLMSERYMINIEHGLLYYLHTDHTQGIFVTRSDLIGLIMRRNDLANDLLKASTIQQLPPMLCLQTCAEVVVTSIH